MNKIKTVFCDLDGTLLDNFNKYPNLHFYNYLRQLEKLNINFVIATGRLYEEVLTIFQTMSSFTNIPYLICSGGSQIYDVKEQKFLLNAIFEAKTKEIIWKVLNEALEKNNKLQIVIYYNNGHVSLYPGHFTKVKEHKPKQRESDLTFSIVNKDLDQYFETVVLHKGVNPKHIEKLNLEDLENLCKVVIIDFYGDVNDRLMTELKEKFKDQQDVDLSFSSNHSIEVCVHPYSKGNAVLEVLKKLNVSKNEAIAIGDSGNDLSMFAILDLSACPNWANKIVQNSAKMIFNGNASKWVLPVFQYIIDNNKQ